METHREEDSQSRVSSCSLTCDMLQLEPHVGVMTSEQVRKESYPGVQSTAPKKFSWLLSPITPKNPPPGTVFKTHRLLLIP